MTFRVGQIVKLLPCKKNMAAEVGATAIVTGIETMQGWMVSSSGCQHTRWLKVKWLTGSSTQHDGEYYSKDFAAVGEKQLVFDWYKE